MRIISKYHDYYDSVQSHGQDRSLLYLRKIETERANHPFPEFRCRHTFARAMADGRKVLPNVETRVVGFCGKVYGVLEVQYGHLGPVFCFSAKDAISFTEQYLPKRVIEDYSRKPKYKWGTTLVNNRLMRWHKISVDTFFKWFEDNREAFEEMFVSKRCPVFISDYDQSGQGLVTWNAVLKDIEFYRVIDTHTAFQEIAMFLSNMAQPEKPMPVITDELKAESKGFDRKTSFRKSPGKKKRSRVKRP